MVSTRSFHAGAARAVQVVTPNRASSFSSAAARSRVPMDSAESSSSAGPLAAEPPVADPTLGRGRAAGWAEGPPTSDGPRDEPATDAACDGGPVVDLGNEAVFGNEAAVSGAAMPLPPAEAIMSDSALRRLSSRVLSVIFDILATSPPTVANATSACSAASRTSGAGSMAALASSGTSWTCTFTASFAPATATAAASTFMTSTLGFGSLPAIAAAYSSATSPSEKQYLCMASRAAAVLRHTAEFLSLNLSSRSATKLLASILKSFRKPLASACRHAIASATQTTLLSLPMTMRNRRSTSPKSPGARWGAPARVFNLVSRSRRSAHLTVLATSSSHPRSSGRMFTGSLIS
mmetsp:Transcript_21102/g.63476  ORF Transcript_21102/g.63476 Transcript_21102/m.63476 type:complete len:349 (-) Transcript_21102:1117-2163(-)